MTTPFEKAGYSPEDVFEVIEDSEGRFHKGGLVVLEYDDGSSCPKFKSVGGDKYGFLILGTEVKLHTQTKESVQKKIKFPCAVSAEGLDAEQLEGLHAFFLRQGAMDGFSFSKPPYDYVGVDYNSETNYFCVPESFSEDYDINDVTIYTYQELMEVELEGVKEENINPIPEGFIAWNGGDIPVKEGTMVEVRYRGGESAIVAAGRHTSVTGLLAIEWGHTNNRFDIIAYRLYEDSSVSACEDVEEVLTGEPPHTADKSESPSVTITETSCGRVKMKVVGNFVLQRVGDVWEVEVKNGEAYFYE